MLFHNSYSFGPRLSKSFTSRLSHSLRVAYSYLFVLGGARWNLLLVIKDSRLCHLNLIRKRWPSLSGKFPFYLTTCFLGLSRHWLSTHKVGCYCKASVVNFICKGQASFVLAKGSCKEAVVLVDFLPTFRSLLFMLLVPGLGINDLFSNQQAVNEWVSPVSCLLFDDLP